MQTGWRPWTPSRWSYISLAPPVQSANEPETTAKAHSLDCPNTCPQRTTWDAFSHPSPPDAAHLFTLQPRKRWQLSSWLFFLRAAKERWILPLTVGRVVKFGCGIRRGSFFPREIKKIMPSPSPKQPRRPESGVEFGSWRGGGTSACNLSSRHSPAAGSVRSTRLTPLHGSASRSVFPTQTRPRG